MKMFHAGSTIVTLAALFAAQPAFAGGALAFLSTETTVSSGDAASWMNPYADCPTQPCQVAANNVALPTQTAPVEVTTQKAGGYLVFRFKIPDRTHATAAGAPLVIGDTIVVQLDPNGSRGSGLQMSGGAATDYRYEIRIKGNALVKAVRREPASSTAWAVAPLSANWCPTAPSTAIPQSCIHTNGEVTLEQVAPDYVVQLKIPLSTIGSPGGDFGLAMGIFNDLGHESSPGVSNLTAVTFPFGDMPANTDNPVLDPGVIETVPGGGAWRIPASWGTGFVTAPASSPAQLTFSTSPAAWVSNSIKLSFCDTGRWDDIGVADTSLNQTNLANWYRYERDDPCKMGVWIRASNSAGATSARLLVLWADGGLATNTWRAAHLTPAITFGSGQSTFRVVWDQVPSKGSGLGNTHACLRVYMLPATLNRTDPNTGKLYDDTRIRGISNETQLGEFERAYGFNPNAWNSQIAQMNFTNLAANAVCSHNPPVCKQPAIITEFRQFLLASLEALGPAPAHAQPPSDRFTATPVARTDRTDWPKPEYPVVIVSAQGFTVPEVTSKKPYVFVQSIGGVAWAVPTSMIAGRSVDLGFTMTVPSIAHRDFSSKKVREIRAIPRRILIAVRTSAPDDFGQVKVKVEATTKVLKPGKPQRAKLVVAGERR